MRAVGMFTDFGLAGPYVGQLKLSICRHAPAVRTFDLFHDLAPFDPVGAGYLVASYSREMPPGSIIIGVVDPGVGGERDGVILYAGGRWFVGPQNGLFDPVVVRATRFRAWRIRWRPPRLSATFHGRDVFGPVAGMLAGGVCGPGALGVRFLDWRCKVPRDVERILYIDGFGNAITGMCASDLGAAVELQAGRSPWLRRSRRFADVSEGRAFWYENSSGLVEFAVNKGSASRVYGLEPGVPVRRRSGGGSV